MVVTGTYDPVPLAESDRNVETFDIRAGGLLFGSFADYLKLDSSVDLRERGPNDTQSDLSIRGGAPGQALVLLNGIRINDPQTAHHNMDLPVPLSAVSQIQVLSGSGSTQYGSDAVAGVVNLITQTPPGADVRLRGALGNNGVNQESGVLGGGGKHIDEQLSFDRDFSSGFAPDRDYRNWGLASFTGVRTRLGATDMLLSLSDRAFGADQFYGNFNSWERTKGWFASLRQELGKKTEIDFAYRRHSDLFVLFRDHPQIFTNRHVDQSWEGAVRRSDDLPKHARLHYGGEAFAESIDSNNLGQHSRVHGAGYASYDVRALRRYSFSLGARDDIYAGSRNQISPTASAGAWLSDRWKLRASASRAFRLPSYTDLYYHDPANVGSPNLRPEKAWNYEAGVDWRVRKLHASLAAFQRRDTDLIDYVRASPTDIYRATNFQHLVFTGAEVFLEYKPTTSQTLSAGYTALHGDRAPAPGITSKYVFNYPVNNALVAWQGALGGFIGRTRIAVVDRRGRDPYALWDASMARAKGRLRPFLQLTNITSTVYQEISGVALPKIGVVGGVELVAFRPR